MVRILLASAAFVILASTGYAQGPEMGKQVRFYGCLHFGPEIGCISARDVRTGMLYNVSAARPRPVPRPLVAFVVGTLAPWQNTCQTGPVLNLVRVQYTRRRCPKE